MNHVCGRALGVFVASLTLVLASTSASADEPKLGSAEQTSSPVDQEQAKLHFTAGVNLLQDPGGARYEEAYTEFKRAYDLVHSYKILGNIALCAMKLERDAEAVEAYSRYLAEAKDLEPQEREQAERDLSTLQAGLAKVVIESRPEGVILQDTRVTARGEPMTNVYGPIAGRTELGIRRGHHIFKARFPDGTEVSWESEIKGGETHVFERPAAAVVPVPVGQPETVPRDETSRPIPTSVYVGAAITGALGIGTLVTGLVALDTNSRFRSANDGFDPGRADDLRATGGTLNVLTDVLLIGTVLGAAATTYLFLNRPTVSEPMKTGVFVGPGSLSGRF